MVMVLYRLERYGTVWRDMVWYTVVQHAVL